MLFLFSYIIIILNFTFAIQNKSLQNLSLIFNYSIHIAFNNINQ